MKIVIVHENRGNDQPFRLKYKSVSCVSSKDF